MIPQAAISLLPRRLALGVLAVLLPGPGTALAAPGPIEGSSDGWRFAICRIEAICRMRSEACTNFSGPGDTYIWRDEAGLRLGTSARAAVPVSAYPDLEGVQAALGPDSEGSALIVAPGNEGPGWMRMALLTLRRGEIVNTFHWLTCETRREAPPAPPQNAPSPTPPAGEAEGPRP